MGYRTKQIGLALLYAAIYAVAFRIAWQHSEDQFYLPAGLRIAALLFLPYRFWPSILIGDAVAMMAIRVPIAADLNASAIWPYASSILLSPLVSLAPLAIRKRFTRAISNERWLPVALLVVAIWGVSVSTLLNALLGGPVDSDLVAYIYRFSIGQYLAIMVAVLPVLLWVRRNATTHAPPHLPRDAFIAVVVLGIAYAALPVSNQHWEKLALLGAMLLPPVTLAFLHGWRGAAIGIVVTTLALGLAMPDTGLLGNKDLAVFVAQQSLAVVGTVLMVLGSAVSSEYDKTSRLQRAKTDALWLARCNHLSAEMLLRDCAQAIADAQAEFDAGYHKTAKQLKAEGRYSLALQVNTQGFQNSRMLFEQVTALYPLDLDSLGLFEVLQSDEFLAVAYGSVTRVSLRGSIDQHSSTLQLVAHRSIAHAIELLPHGESRLQVRAWTLRRRRGISVTLRSESKTSTQPDAQRLRLAETQLQAKVQAYGGAFKRRRMRVVFTLTEDVDQFLETGTITHATPLLPFSALTTK
ncbi:histidine kinase [Xanthomonas sp. GW]|nr:histidine kinase [Xanthomonas sp. GW]